MWPDWEAKKSMKFFVELAKKDIVPSHDEVFKLHKEATGSKRNVLAVKYKIRAIIKELKSKKSTEHDEDTLRKILGLLSTKENSGGPKIVQETSRSSRTKQETLKPAVELESLVEWMLTEYNAFHGPYELRAVSVDWSKSHPSARKPEELLVVLKEYVDNGFQTDGKTLDYEVARALVRFRFPVHPEFRQKLMAKAKFQIGDSNVLVYYQIGNKKTGKKDMNLPLLGGLPGDQAPSTIAPVPLNNNAADNAPAAPMSTGSNDQVIPNPAEREAASMETDDVTEQDSGKGTSSDSSRKRKKPLATDREHSKRAALVKDQGHAHVPSEDDIAETIPAKTALEYLQDAITIISNLSFLERIRDLIEGNSTNIDQNTMASTRTIGNAMSLKLGTAIKNALTTTYEGGSVKLLEVIQTFRQMFAKLNSPFVEEFKKEVEDAFKQFETQQLVSFCK